MEERIILCNSVNERELKITLALNGINTVGLRVMSAYDLAVKALADSGYYPEKEVIKNSEYVRIIKEVAGKEEYFKELSLNDAKNLAAAITMMRMMSTDNDNEKLKNTLIKGEFYEKNRDILNSYLLYEDYIKGIGKTDKINVILQAISIGIKSRYNIYVLKEFPLLPLEIKLAETLSDGLYKEICFADLFEVRETVPVIDQYAEAYGIGSEIENVLKDIHDKGLPFDNVTVITGDMNVYQEQLLYYADRYDLPMTLSDGYPVYLLNTGKVLKGIFQWDQEEYHNFNVLWNVVNSKNFNIRLLKEKVFKGIETPGKLKDIVKLVSSMRLSINEEENKRKIDRYLQAAGEEETDTIEALRRFSEELEKGYGYFAAEYAERETRISDSLSRQCILSYFEDLQGEPFTSNHLNDLLNRRIGSESFRAGFMHITSLRGAFSSIRNYNYLIGLSADYFPGSPKENYLLLDSDLDLFAFDRALTSSEKIEQKKEMLYHFLGLASGLNKTLRLSYAGYDTSELKDQNASSLLFEIFRLTRGEEASMEDFKKNIRHTGYFDTDISNYAAVGREYLKEAEITDNPEESREKLKFDLPQRSFSPTAIDAYFNCPRKFYLTKILGIEEPEEHDPFEIIRANDLGTLVHEMMELTADHSLTEEDFVQQANIAFDRYLSEHVPVSKEKAERSRQEYLQMIRTGYRQNPKNRVISAENRFYTTHESGIRLNGTPDRIEYTDDGRCIIVDYKTYRNEENLENDYESCRQVIIYAYISEKNGYKPEHCEYRYLRYPVVVKCVYNDQMKELLAKDLETLKKALEENDFPCTENKDSCTFCKLAHICGKSEVNKDEQ